MNLFPPLIALLVLIACGLFLWRRRVAGAVLFAVTLIMVLVVAIFCVG
jgi:glucose dehydrogenase